VELALLDSVRHPVKMHVHGFGALLFYSVVNNAKGKGVVCLDGVVGCGLWVIQFFKGSVEWDCFFGV
jgi:hypothetical protein